MIERYKETIEQAYGIKIVGNKKKSQNDIEKQKVIHDFMETEGDRVSTFEKMQEGKVYATIFGGNNIRVFVMPDENNIVGAPDFTDIYTDFCEIQSITDKNSRIESIVRDGRVRLKEGISFNKTLGVYHLNGHSAIKAEVLEKLKDKEDKRHYIGYTSEPESD
jgi:hypothetical protein